MVIGTSIMKQSKHGNDLFKQTFSLIVMKLFRFVIKKNNENFCENSNFMKNNCKQFFLRYGSFFKIGLYRVLAFSKWCLPFSNTHEHFKHM
jgi:hypothetical protein